MTERRRPFWWEWIGIVLYGFGLLAMLVVSLASGSLAQVGYALATVVGSIVLGIAVFRAPVSSSKKEAEDA